MSSNIAKCNEQAPHLTPSHGGIRTGNSQLDPQGDEADRKPKRRRAPRKKKQ